MSDALRSPWPMAATLAWVAAACGGAIVATGGLVLRPGVTIGPMVFAATLALGVAAGWPLVLRTAVARALVAGSGATAIAIVAAAQDAPAGPALIAWAIAFAALIGPAIVCGRNRFARPVAWTAITIGAAALVTLSPNLK